MLSNLPENPKVLCLACGLQGSDETYGWLLSRQGCAFPWRTHQDFHLSCLSLCFSSAPRWMASLHMTCLPKLSVSRGPPKGNGTKRPWTQPSKSLSQNKSFHLKIYLFRNFITLVGSCLACGSMPLPAYSFHRFWGWGVKQYLAQAIQISRSSCVCFLNAGVEVWTTTSDCLWLFVLFMCLFVI